MDLDHHISGFYRNVAVPATSRRNPADHLLIWVLEGSMDATVGGRRIRARSGDLVSFPPGAAHEYDADRSSDWSWLWVHYGGELAAEVTAALMGDLDVVPFGHPPAVRSAFSGLVVAAATDGPPSPLRPADARLVALLGLMLEHRTRDEGTPRDDRDLELVLAWISEHLADPIDLAALVARSGYSAAQLTRLFRARTGLAPIAYLTQARMTQAAWMLAETRASIAEVARSVGYDDQFHFSRRFRQLRGAAPSPYRDAATQKSRARPS
jgi:AraC family transcriptional regulator, arabinose operon regulatory protein